MNLSNLNLTIAEVTFEFNKKLASVSIAMHFSKKKNILGLLTANKDFKKVVISY